MMHVCIFPTFYCQSSCIYCSIRQSKIDRSVPSVSWQQWANALSQIVPRGSIIDIAGGEPLLYDGLIDLLHVLGQAGLRWAITTNAKATAVIERLCRERPIGCVCFNISDHSGNPESVENKLLLRRSGYHVNVHRVDHPAAGNRHPDAQVITYQDWMGNQAVDGIMRRCTAGINHWIAGPNGDLWRCIVAAEMGQLPFGNLFTGERQPIDAECIFGCSACYTEDSASWFIKMEVA